MVDENCLNRLSSDLYVYTMEVPAKHNPSVSKEVNKLNKILVKINLSPLSYLGHSTKKPVNTSFLWVFMGTNRIVIEKLLFFDHNPYLFFSPLHFLDLLVSFYMPMNIFCLHVCMGMTCVSSARGGQERKSNLLKLKLQVLVNYQVGAGNQIQVLYKSRRS